MEKAKLDAEGGKCSGPIIGEGVKIFKESQ